jgi:CubicO group peptidase (beta-lactamase class C family)
LHTLNLIQARTQNYTYMLTLKVPCNSNRVSTGQVGASKPHSTMDLINKPTFRQHAEELMEHYHLPGISISVTQDDELATIGFGVSSRVSQEPASADTLYDIASCSKSLTAASVALLVEDNDNFPEIQWTTPLHELLPEDFVMPTPELTKRVTVEDMLSHRTGMAL